MEADGLCRYLEWDSEFFGLRVASVAARRLDSEAAARVLDWCDAQRIKCLYFLADMDDPVTTRLAEDNGFRLVDARVELERRAPSGAGAEAAVDEASCLIRPCEPDDIPALRSIARVSHRDSRFYYDPNFPDASCDALYELWVEKSCRGYADAVLVAEFEGRAVGYASCHLSGQTGGGEIGLVGVGAEARGRGLGRRLIEESLRWFDARGVDAVSVATQGRNGAAQRLYQRSGFLTRSVRLWYHRWF